MSPAFPILGLHHVTAIAGDPQSNLDFYSKVLGLRMVKRTVNFDDPSVYHLYFSDAAGTPGSVLTFFPFPGARQGHPGIGQATATAFAAPAASLAFWTERLSSHGVEVDLVERFGDEVLRFKDTDGLPLEIVFGANGTERDLEPQPWASHGVEAGHALLGFDHVTLTVADAAATRRVLGVMGFRALPSAASTEGARQRFEVGDGGSGARVDVLEAPSAPRARGGAGTVHHVAFRNRDDASQAEWLEHLARQGVPTTDVKDRQYFHSIYFREPGGVLFELATDPPGFALDEPQESLSQELKLPPWLETSRSQIESSLPPLQTNEK